MKAIGSSTLIAMLLLSSAALADDKIVKIGNLGDQSSLYADLGGPGSTIAAQLAIEDSGLTKKGWTIDLIAADHQNKPDVGASLARQWFDVDKVDAIIDVQNSGVALAVAGVAKEKNGIFLPSGPASSDLTGKACSPNTIHWAYDTYALANGTGKAITKNGGDAWFFLTADYAFGHALQRDTTAVIEANGGKVLGSVRHPLNTADFGSYLLLMLGYFTCGFQLAFITIHLPPYLVDKGLSTTVGGWTIAVIGLFNIFGSIASGYIANLMPKRYLLSAIYFSRSLAILVFILLPSSPAATLIFGAVMGVLWLSTIPPTSALVAIMFGNRWLTMLLGLAFFSHQVGGFLGVWLGGVLFESTGSYDVIWWGTIFFGVASAVINLPIVEQPVARPAAAAA